MISLVINWVKCRLAFLNTWAVLALTQITLFSARFDNIDDFKCMLVVLKPIRIKIMVNLMTCQAFNCIVVLNCSRRQTVNTENSIATSHDFGDIMFRIEPIATITACTTVVSIIFQLNVLDILKFRYKQLRVLVDQIFLSCTQIPLLIEVGLGSH
jgi:hypothetical protein